MLAPPDALVHALKPWAELYAQSKIASSVVTFLHVGALVVAGGFALSTDGDTFRAVRGTDAARARHLDDLRSVHAWVAVGLVVSVISGLFLFAANVPMFYGSVVFWLKMALIVALLANGHVMRRTERGLRDHTAGAGAWNTLRATSTVSIALWFTISLAGVILVNL